MLRRLPFRLAAPAALAGALLALLMLPGGAGAAITPTTTADDLATALSDGSSVVTGASFVTTPSGSPNAVATDALAGFPLAGGSYAMMTNGDATLAPGAPPEDPQEAFASVADGGGHVRANSDANEFDVTILKVDLNVPATANCVSVGFRFLSEEYPDFVGSDVNDSFIAELDTDDWTTSTDGTVTAPHNFAFDTEGKPITVNTAGITAEGAAGTTYGGATGLLQASTPITPGAHSLYLSIFDQGDDVYDSAAFLDNLVVGQKSAGQCETGAIDAPLVTLDQPADGSTVNDSTPTLSGQAGTQPGDDSTVTVNVYPGSSASGTPIETKTAPVSAGGWSIASDALADGIYTAQAQQSDTDGNVGTSTAHTFTIDTSGADTTPPTVTLDQPADGVTLDDPTPDLSGLGGTAPGDDAAVTVRVFAGSGTSGTPVQTTSAAVTSDGSWTTTAAALTDGTYTVQAEQDDADGNQGFSNPHTFSVDTSPPDTTPPVVSVDRPADGSRIADATPSISGSGGRAPGDDPSVTVRVYRGARPSGAPVQTSTAGIGSTGAWAVVAGALPDGTYTVQAEQDDAGGNAGFSAAHAFTIDTMPTAPPPAADTTAPSPTIDQPAQDASVTDRTPTIAGGAGTAPGDDDHVRVELYRGPTPGGATTWSGTATVQGGRWSVEAPTLAFGRYTALVRQGDAAGNDGVSSPRRFSVDSPAGADLQVGVQSKPLPVVVGHPLTYTIEIHNHGPDDATGVRMAVLLPAGADLPDHEDFAPNPSGCSRSGRTMFCFAGLLASRQTLTYRFTVTPRQAGAMDARVSVVAAQADPVDSDNRGLADLTAEPPPVLAKNVLGARVSGTVRVRRPGARHFRTLTTEAVIPVGSLVNATHGRVRITSRRSAGGPTQTADFFRGAFLLRQLRTHHGLTLLDLRGGSFAGCPERAPSSTTAHVARRRHRRGLWGSGHGSFRTRGRYGSATVRGTIWFTQDRCRGTAFTTRRGVVSVRDFVRRATVKVPAGHTYVARARHR